MTGNRREYHSALYESLCDEIDMRVSTGSDQDRRVYFTILQSILDDRRPMPTAAQVLSVSSPIVRLVLNEVHTKWSPARAAAFRHQVLQHMDNVRVQQQLWA